MLNQNAQKWVAALRSGKYAQTKGTLHDSNGYCCLGVACDLYEKEVGGLLMPDGTFGGNTATIPYKVRDWLGLHKYNELGSFDNPLECSDGKRRYRLADMNDAGMSFNKIADVIEDEPIGLFV